MVYIHFYYKEETLLISGESWFWGLV